MSGTKLYVGNLPYSTTDEELKGIFGEHGSVKEAQVISDRDTGQSKGFGFVEFETSQEADDAQAALNEYEIDGRKLRVNEAHERKSKPQRGNGGGDRRY